MEFFDFGNGVKARIRSIVAHTLSYVPAKTREQVDTAVERTTTRVGAQWQSNLFGVFSTWILHDPNDSKNVFVRLEVRTEFEFEDIRELFTVDEKQNMMSPRNDLDLQFFSIAYASLRGIAVSRLAGTSWASRIPALRSPDELRPVNVSEPLSIEQPQVKKKRSAGKKGES